MIRTLVLLALALPLPLALLGCNPGATIPSENVRDYHVTFVDADASESCSDDIKAEADGHEEYSETYRIHWVDGPDQTRVDIWWKERGAADLDYRYFAAGTQEGTLDEGAINYAGGLYEETRGSAIVTYRIEGRAPTRFGDSLPNGTEEYVITDSTESEYRIGCVYTLYYNGNLASPQDGVD